MRILGLAGFPGAGKDTLAKVLMEKRPSFKRVAFADPVREAALALDPLIGKDCKGSPLRLSEVVEEAGWDFAKSLPEVRRTLQRLGTEVGRNLIGLNTWVRLAWAEMVQNRALGYDVVVTDVRFPNEAKMIREFGGRVIWIDRPGVTGSDHASDTSLKESDCDLSLRNTFDLSPGVVDGIDLDERKEFLADILEGMLGDG